MIFNAEEYAKKNTSMPNRDNPELDKDSSQYNLKVAEYVYSQFCKGTTQIDGYWYSSVRLNRQYALGMQDESIYMDSFYGKEDTNGVLQNFNTDNQKKARRKAYANLNFTIQSPMPRVMDAIVGKLMDSVNMVSVDAIDEHSGAKREELKWGTYVDGKYRKEFDSLRALMALPQQEKRYTPRNVEELNLYESEGGFKLAYEETMERLLRFTFDQSGWEENTLEKVIYDLVTNGFACVEDVYNPVTGLVTAEYRDAEYAGVQYTNESAYSKPDYGFYIKMVKLSDLRAMGFEDDDVVPLAKQFSGHFGNPTIGDWNKKNKASTAIDGNDYDEYQCPVFVVKWIDVEFKKEKKYKNRQGRVRTKEVEPNYKKKEREEILTTRIKTVRQVHWVIGSDLIYDYGKAKFQARDGLSEPALPIHMVKVSGRPIVPRLRPSLDQYMNSWMRLQQGISMAAMNGYAINMDAISNLQMNGSKMKPTEVLRFWRQTGTLFFKPTDVMGRTNSAAITRPIEQLPGGAGAVIAESVQGMDISMKQIEDLTGFNPIAMGGSPNPDQGKAVTEYAMMGMSDVLKPVLKQVNVLKSNVARNMCLRLQHVVQTDQTAYKAYQDVVGETSLELLKISDGGDVKYGIRTHARPTQQDIAELKQTIAISLQNGRDGKVGITEADAVRFNAMINSGSSLKQVALLLDFANHKAKEEEEARSARAQQLSQQGAQQLAAMKLQQEQQQVAMETQSDIAKTNSEAVADLINKAYDKGELNFQAALGMLRPQMAQQSQQQ